MDVVILEFWLSKTVSGDIEKIPLPTSQGLDMFALIKRTLFNYEIIIPRKVYDLKEKL